MRAASGGGAKDVPPEEVDVIEEVMRSHTEQGPRLGRAGLPPRWLLAGEAWTFRLAHAVGAGSRVHPSCPATPEDAVQTRSPVTPAESEIGSERR